MNADGARRGGALWATLTGLAVALIGPALLSVWSPAPGAAPLDATAAILLNEAAVWTLTLALLAIVRVGERRPLASIGLVRPSWRALVAGAVVMLALVALAGLAAVIVSATGLPLQQEQQQTQLILGLPIWLQLAVAASAGFTEEVLFRGFPIERLTALTGRRWLGALVPILVFGAVHAPFWGLAHALVAGMSGLWLTLLYLWRRNLLTNIVAHGLMDATAFLALDYASAHGAMDA
jgi:membrane protease YdiL (CAAX protease family)